MQMIVAFTQRGSARLLPSRVTRSRPIDPLDAPEDRFVTGAALINPSDSEVRRYAYAGLGFSASMPSFFIASGSFFASNSPRLLSSYRAA